jgi:archaellum component FlaF (FlaF/FlaG flagellin family)
LTRHLKYRCKAKIENELKKEKIYQALLIKMEKQNKEMQNQNKRIQIQNDALIKKISKLETKMVQNNTNNTINNNNSNNNNINIKVVAFGKEDKDVLTDNEIFKILKRGFYSVPELIKAIHFNKDKPENHNVYISNMRDKYVMVFDQQNKFVLG